MANRHGGRFGDKPRPQLVQSPGKAGISKTDMPAEVAESLRQEFTDELRLVLRKSNVSPDLIYVFSKTGRIVTEENRELLTSAERSGLETGAARVSSAGRGGQQGH